MDTTFAQDITEAILRELIIGNDLDVLWTLAVGEDSSHPVLTNDGSQNSVALFRF